MSLPEARSRDRVRDFLVGCRDDGAEVVGEADAKAALSAWGIPCNRGYTIAAESELREILGDVPLPAVLKVDAAGYPHKTEYGLVVLGCSSRAEVTAGFRQLEGRISDLGLASGSYRILVEEMVSSASEWILGIRNEPGLGTAVLFGAGGVYTELLDDVAVGFYPLDENAIELMIAELRFAPLLAGYRGQPAVSEQAVVEVLAAAAAFGHDLFDLVSAVDINPILVSGKSHELIAVDALITLRAHARDLDGGGANGR